MYRIVFALCTLYTISGWTGTSSSAAPIDRFSLSFDEGNRLQRFSFRAVNALYYL